MGQEQQYAILLNQSEMDLLRVGIETAKGETEKLEGFEIYAEAFEKILNKLYNPKSLKSSL